MTTVEARKQQRKRNSATRKQFAKDASRFSDTELRIAIYRNGHCNSRRPKVKYLSDGEAWAAIVTIYPDEPNMHAYRCEHCDTWHIGHAKYPDWAYIEAMRERVDIARGPHVNHCSWPIVDQNVPTASLLAEALDDLSAHLKSTRREMVGFPQFYMWDGLLRAKYLEQVAA